MQQMTDKDESYGTDIEGARDSWRRASRSRLRFELAGLAFACQKGFRPRDYARHLWGEGAVRWMGKDRPEAAEYLNKEAEAFRRFYPGVAFQVIEAGKERAELVFTEGCLGGWGKDPWKLARSLELSPKDVCKYCKASFQNWAEQLGLTVDIGPAEDGVCRMRVARHGAIPPASS